MYRQSLYTHIHKQNNNIKNYSIIKSTSSHFTNITMILKVTALLNKKNPNQVHKEN